MTTYGIVETGPLGWTMSKGGWRAASGQDMVLEVNDARRGDMDDDRYTIAVFYAGYHPQTLPYFDLETAMFAAVQAGLKLTPEAPDLLAAREVLIRRLNEGEE